jgi:hypothetical protein
LVLLPRRQRFLHCPCSMMTKTVEDVPAYRIKYLLNDMTTMRQPSDKISTEDVVPARPLSNISIICNDGCSLFFVVDNDHILTYSCRAAPVGSVEDNNESKALVLTATMVGRASFL